MILLALAVAALPARGPADAAAPAPSLLLVTVDTLRADRLRCYGYASIETPAADRLAREGVLVTDATVQAPQTRPSHASILTGRHPHEHGIRDNYSPPLRRDLPTLATILEQRGYRTGAFVGSYALAAVSGLNRGFDRYDEPFSESGGGLYTRPERRASEVVDSALAWLREARSAPFFAWVHLYDPHAPYAPPAPYDRLYAGRPYDGEVAFSDAQIGRLLDHLDRTGSRGRTLVVVTADHGEGLGDHGEDEHLMFVYDSTLRVPLLLSWPGVLPAGAQIAGQFRSVDLLPTVLDLLGHPIAPSSGVSRAANLRRGGRLPENESYSESLFGQLHFGYAPLRAIRAEGWKYVDAPQPELYNLRDDPGETRNLADLRAQVAGHLRGRLRSYDGAAAGRPAPELAAPDAGVMERLAALGYVGGGVSRSGAGGADPKDKIGEYQAYNRDVQKAMELSSQGRLDEAIVLLTRLSKSDTLSLEVSYHLGTALLRKKRFLEAAGALEEALALVPRFTLAYVDLSRAYAGLGKMEDARATLERGLRLEDRSPVLLAEKGLLLHRLGDLAGARATLERALVADRRNVRLRLALSAVHRDLGDEAGAARELEEAVRLAPEDNDAWNALGVIRAESGKLAEAGEAFEKALAIRPADPDALFNLADCRTRTGRPGEAVALLDTLMTQFPDYPGAATALERARAASRPLDAGHAELLVIRTADRPRAEEALRRLASGEDFAAIARSLSSDPTAPDGGTLGEVRVGDLAEPLRSAASILAVGALSPIVETPSGFVILRRVR